MQPHRADICKNWGAVTDRRSAEEVLLETEDVYEEVSLRKLQHDAGLTSCFVFKHFEKMVFVLHLHTQSTRWDQNHNMLMTRKSHFHSFRHYKSSLYTKVSDMASFPMNDQCTGKCRALHCGIVESSVLHTPWTWLLFHSIVFFMHIIQCVYITCSECRL